MFDTARSLARANLAASLGREPTSSELKVALLLRTYSRDFDPAVLRRLTEELRERSQIP